MIFVELLVPVFGFCFTQTSGTFSRVERRMSSHHRVLAPFSASTETMGASWGCCPFSRSMKSRRLFLFSVKVSRSVGLRSREDVGGVGARVVFVGCFFIHPFGVGHTPLHLSLFAFPRSCPLLVQVARTLKALVHGRLHGVHYSWSCDGNE